MSKRPFQRLDGSLVDEYEDPPGVKARFDLPEDSLRESLRVMQGETPKVVESAPIDESLERLRLGNVDALLFLAGHLDDPRVPPAIVAAARVTHAEHAERFAQMLGFIGGPDAKALLESQLNQHALAPGSMEDAPLWNRAAAAACRVAGALIALDADHRRAADVLLQLFDHPSRNTRRFAVRTAADCYRDDLATNAQLALRRALFRQLESTDDALFLAAAPAFWRREHARAYSRWLVLLDHADVDARRTALDLLDHLPRERRGLAAVLSRIPDEPSLGLAMLMATHVAELLPSASRAELVRRALKDDAPAHRLGGVQMLRGVDAPTRLEIARAAAADEPDPLLKSELEQLATT